jgi:hypothetical protein
MRDHWPLAHLLYEGEGNTLDFKSEQYRFSGATDDEKSELLKDIVAFANAWRNSDAYILIGVKEVKGGRGEIIGISEHLEDAHIQQFVNQKTQRPIEFSYKPSQIDGFTIGIIHIPVQHARPFYLKKDFGFLKQSQVYIRRSSSTDVANPDEIATMGKVVGTDREKPILEVFLVSGDHDEILEKIAERKIFNTTIPSPNEFPDYGIEKRTDNGLISLQSVAATTVNRNYYRDHAAYLQAYARVRGFKIGIKNVGAVPARDVKVVIGLNNDGGTSIVHEERDLPPLPIKQTSIFDRGSFGSTHKEPDVTVKTAPTGWSVTCHLGKIQSGDMVSTYDHLYLGASTPKVIELNAQVFSDDLSGPKVETLKVCYEVEDRVFSITDLGFEKCKQFTLSSRQPSSP